MKTEARQNKYQGMGVEGGGLMVGVGEMVEWGRNKRKLKMKHGAFWQHIYK